MWRLIFVQPGRFSLWGMRHFNPCPPLIPRHLWVCRSFTRQNAQFASAISFYGWNCDCHAVVSLRNSIDVLTSFSRQRKKCTSSSLGMSSNFLVSLTLCFPKIKTFGYFQNSQWHSIFDLNCRLNLSQKAAVICIAWALHLLVLFLQNLLSLTLL